MSRMSKPGKFINCKVDINLVNKLDSYSEKTRIPKTAIVEMALEDYFNKMSKKSVKKNVKEGAEIDG